MVEVKSWITGIILIIIAIVIIFSVIGGTTTSLTGGADSITDANNCSEGSDNTGVKFKYNITDKYCYNTSDSPEFLAGQYNLPLNTLFSSNGVVLLIFMAGILMLVIGLAFTLVKKKA